MKFYPYESVEIPRTEKGLIDNSKPAMIEFWESVEELEEGLS
ncbi:hypothetical protein P7M10_23825 [Vibrio parahaemolyticus]|nr:hypothetical protein [Vibrio parahaemolyticus]